MYNKGGSLADIGVGVNSLLYLSIGANTRRMYQSGLNSYQDFLNHFSLRGNSTELSPFPTEEILLSYIFYCHEIKKVTYSTIKCYLSGIRFHFIVSVGINPFKEGGGTLERLQIILRAVKKCQIPRPVKRLPITAPIITDMLRVLTGSPTFGLAQDAMLAASITTAFFGFLRCGEFCMSNTNSGNFLAANDILWEPGYDGYTLRLRASKTDPFRKGVDIYISALGMDNELCPARHLKRYWLLRKCSKVPMSGPLFLTGDCALTRDCFINMTRSILQKAGYDSRSFSGHSYRAGGASSCSRANIQDHLIKVLGRWKSDAYQRYISISRETIKRAQLAMSLECHA